MLIKIYLFSLTYSYLLISCTQYETLDSLIQVHNDLIKSMALSME